MRRNETVALLVVALTLISAGLTWRFGFWGLTGSGAALLLIALFAKHEEDDDE